MPRAVDGTRRAQRRKKILKRAHGFRGARSKLFRTAKDAVAKADLYAYRDRKVRKRNFRSLWIARISAACRAENMRYSEFINLLHKHGIVLNRKMLSNMAIQSPEEFKRLVVKIRQ